MVASELTGSSQKFCYVKSCLQSLREDTDELQERAACQEALMKDLISTIQRLSFELGKMDKKVTNLEKQAKYVNRIKKYEKQQRKEYNKQREMRYQCIDK